MTDHDPRHSGPIVSEFADDPDMSELVGLFVGDLPGRVASLRRAVALRDVATLRTISHQMKGAAPGYGFPQLGEAAASIEDAIRHEDGEGSQTVEALRAQVDSLIAMCGRVRLAD